MTPLLLHPAVLAALAYLAVTIVFQFRPLSTRLSGLDAFGILPRWKFFIPQPERFDLAIMLRGGPSDDELGEWKPVPMFAPRHALSWLWFPEQHHGGVLLLSAYRVATCARRGDEAGIHDMLAYRTLVRHARRLAAAAGDAVFQFALVEPGADTLFTSPVQRR